VRSEWTKGGKCGKPTSNSLSFSITKSVGTKHLVDVTSPHIARSCWPMLQLHYRRRSDGWMARYVTSVVEVCGRRRDGQTRVRVRLPPVPARLSPTTPPPARRQLTGACQEPEHGRTDGRATWYAAGLADHRRSTAYEDNAAAVLRTVPRCN